MRRKVNYRRHTANSLLEIIKKRSDDGKNMIRVKDLITNAPDRNSGLQNIKELLQLLIAGKVVITENRREKDEPYIIYSGEVCMKDKAENSDYLKKLFEVFILYGFIAPNPITENFHMLTDQVYSSHAIFAFSKQAKLSYTETRILLSTINGFISGQHPCFLNDMRLNTKELAFYCHQFLETKSILIHQDLLKIMTDLDGISCRVCLTKRSLQLMQNIPIETLEEDKKRRTRFYVYKPSGTIPKIKLYFNSSASLLFDNITKLIRKQGRNKNSAISVLLYGPSGTGKTEFAYQLARKTGGGIIQLDFSQIQSKWIGETEKNIRSAFLEYEELYKKTNKPLILLMNEADGLINKRVNVRTSNDVFANQAQAQLLELLESFNGILIATTNMFQNIDTAFHRRFLFKCKIDLPDLETRKKLMENSTLLSHICDTTKERMLQGNWTAAQLRNVEQKIAQLELLDVIAEQMIDDLLYEEGLLRQAVMIGFDLAKMQA